MELETELYRQYVQTQTTRQNIYRTPGGDKGDSLIGLGFGDVTYFEGCEVTYEYGLPPGVGYGFNLDQMELMSLQGQLFVPEGPDYDSATKSWRFSIDFFGNLWSNPRYQVKWLAGG